MAGERWAQVKAILAGIDTGSLLAAARDWEDRDTALSRIHSQMYAQNPFEVSGAVGEAAEQLTAGATYAENSLLTMSTELLNVGAVLQFLAADIEALRTQMAEDENGPLFTLPDPAYEPVTPAGSLIADLVRQEFDQRADVYHSRLHELVASAEGSLETQVTSTWPGGLPKVDPDDYAPNR